MYDLKSDETIRITYTISGIVGQLVIKLFINLCQCLRYETCQLTRVLYIVSPNHHPRLPHGREWHLRQQRRKRRWQKVSSSIPRLCLWHISCDKTRWRRRLRTTVTNFICQTDSQYLRPCATRTTICWLSLLVLSTICWGLVNKAMCHWNRCAACRTKKNRRYRNALSIWARYRKHSCTRIPVTSWSLLLNQSTSLLPLSNTCFSAFRTLSLCPALQVTGRSTSSKSAANSRTHDVDPFFWKCHQHHPLYCT